MIQQVVQQGSCVMLYRDVSGGSVERDRNVREIIIIILDHWGPAPAKSAPPYTTPPPPGGFPQPLAVTTSPTRVATGVRGRSEALPLHDSPAEYGCEIWLNAYCLLHYIILRFKFR